MGITAATVQAILAPLRFIPTALRVNTKAGDINSLFRSCPPFSVGWSISWQRVYTIPTSL